MRPGRWVGLRRIRDKAFGNTLLAGLCCSLVVSCGQSDDGPTVLGPPPTVPPLELFGDVLYRADGTEVDIATIESKPIIGIYFAAGWCSACAGFTPLLVNVYEELEQAGKSFEVVFVSFDEDAADMFTYMTDRGMPWLALPCRGLKANALTLRYGVNAIPTLIVIDDEGNTITTDGRIDVATKGAQAYDDWLVP